MRDLSEEFLLSIRRSWTWEDEKSQFLVGRRSQVDGLIVLLKEQKVRETREL